MNKLNDFRLVNADKLLEMCAMVHLDTKRCTIDEITELLRDEVRSDLYNSDAKEAIMTVIAKIENLE